MASKLTPTMLLRSAAQMVDRALGQLDTEHERCAGCGARKFRKFDEAKVYEQLNSVPERLRTAATRLAGTASETEQTEE